MREIKFRAWDKDRMEMIYNEFTLHSGGFITSFGKDVNWPVMQFTGLLDRHGKDIYEGDILREQQDNCSPKTWAVEWYIDDIHCGWNIDPAMTWYSEVIGNIYENKELLNE